ncbi:MAG: DsrE/DsrF/DrsH-like family protein [Candidatus Helarchaeota archaeon]
MKKLAFIIGSKTFEKIMMPLIIAQTAEVMDIEVHMFFTFWGLQMLKKGKIDKAKVGGVPFPFKRLAARQFKKKLKKFGTPNPSELIKEIAEGGNVHYYACTMTMELMGVKKEDIISEVSDKNFVGAAKFLEICEDADQILVFA